MSLTEYFLNITTYGAEWVLWLLVLLSIVSVAIMVERGVFYLRRSLEIDGFSKALRKAVKRNATQDFVKRNKKNEDMASMTVLAGLRELGGGAEAVSEAMNAEKSRQQRRYGQNLVVLGTLGNNAPFVGLFGTVLGIINAFQDLEDNPAGGIEVVMSSLSEALVATAVGLLVAIPAVIAFNVFNRRMQAAVASTDSAAHDLLSAIHGGAFKRDDNNNNNDDNNDGDDD